MIRALVALADAHAALDELDRLIAKLRREMGIQPGQQIRFVR